MAVILLVAAPISVLRSFFLASYTASVPTLVGRSQVGSANAYFEAVYTMGFIAGPAIAGILATTIGPGATLAIDAASFGLSALGLVFVRRDLKAPTGRPHAPMAAEIREGIDYVLDEPDAAHRDPVLGRHLDRHGAVRDGAGRPRHPRPR